MIKKITQQMLLLLAPIVSVYGQSTVFYENFSKETDGQAQTGSITNWNILSGNIDVSKTYIQYPDYDGKGIDLAGLVNSSIELKNSITLSPGTYTISFLAKDNTWGDSEMLLEIGDLFTKKFNATSVVKPYSETFTVVSATSVKIKLTELGSNNTGGTFIGDIKLSKSCPTTVFYEDFSKETDGQAQTGSITNWNILSGNIDVSVTYLQHPDYKGKGIDLAGLVNASIESKNSFLLNEGTYTVSFLARDNTWGNSEMKLEIGGLFTKNFNATSTVQYYSETFTVSKNESVKIKLTEVGPNNTGGTFLGDFKLIEECPVVLCPTTVFYEDFSKETDGQAQTGSIINWDILSGNIDVSVTYIQHPDYKGKGIDLAGLENASIETKNSFLLNEGTYTVSFLARDNTWGNSEMKMEIGDLFTKNFNATSTVQSYSETFTVSKTESVKIKLTEVGPNNTGGTFLGDFKLIKKCSTVTAIDNIEKESSSIRVFPNPSNGIINIEAPTNSKVTLVSTDGQRQELIGNNQNVYNVTAKPGVYFLLIRYNEKVEYQKIQITE